MSNEVQSEQPVVTPPQSHPTKLSSTELEDALPDVSLVSPILDPKSPMHEVALRRAALYFAQIKRHSLIDGLLGPHMNGARAVIDADLTERGLPGLSGI